jgi:hypothetical protein
MKPYKMRDEERCRMMFVTCVVPRLTAMGITLVKDYGDMFEHLTKYNEKISFHAYYGDMPMSLIVKREHRLGVRMVVSLFKGWAGYSVWELLVLDTGFTQCTREFDMMALMRNRG